MCADRPDRALWAVVGDIQVDTVKLLSDQLLGFVRNVDVPVLPNCMQTGAMFAFVMGGAFFLGVWTVVLMIASVTRRQEAHSEPYGKRSASS